MKKLKQPKIGIALGGGGARGLAHLGVLKVLQEENIKIDMVAGVSMGSIIGAYYVLGLSLADLDAQARNMTRRKAISELVDLNSDFKSVLKGKKAMRFITKLIGDADFKDALVPFKVVAADLATGEEVILEKGRIIDAIQASICVPGIFPPVKIEDRLLVDGGLVNPTPVDLVEDMGADIAIGIDLIMRRDDEESVPNFNILGTIMQSYEIIRTQGVKYNLGKATDNIIVIKPQMKGAVDSFKFHDIGRFIDAGEDAARHALPKIRQVLQNFEA